MKKEAIPHMVRRVEAVALSVFLWLSGVILPPLSDSRAQAAGADTAIRAVKAMFLTVGKADAALIEVGDKRYLVDTGTRDSAEAMLSALAYYKITRLNGVLITHIDKDHVGGLKTLLKSDIAVDRLYAATYHNAYSLEDHPVAKQAEKYAIPLGWLNSRDQIAIDADSYFEVLGPLTRDPENENNNSLVLRLVTPQGNMLLTGDMEAEEEQALLNAGLIQPTTVLKVGHHGNNDASSDSFIYTVRPQIAVISTDSSEEPDTPDPEVIARLWNVGAEVFLTEKATRCVMVTLEGGNAVGRLENDGVNGGCSE